MLKTTDKLKSFEENYEKLEKLVNSLDDSGLTLKESLDIFEKSVKLARDCESALEYARQRAQALAEIQGAAEKESEEGEAGPVPEEGTLGL